jgi:hypothetical protein
VATAYDSSRHWEDLESAIPEVEDDEVNVEKSNKEE